MTSQIKLTDVIAPSFYELFNDFMSNKHTHYMAEGGRGSTKSSWAGTMTPLSIIDNPMLNVAVFRKYANTLRNSVYEQIMWSIDKLGLMDEFKFTVSPMEITYKPTGQKILFRGLDDKNKIKSIKCTHGYFGLAWFEELDEYCGMEEIRSVIQSVARGGDNIKVIYTFNPPKSRDNWVNVEKMIDVPNRLVHHSTYLTVPPKWLGKTFIEEAETLKQKNPEAYEHEYLGIATGTGGAVFDNIAERNITDADIRNMDYFYYGIDFGFAIDPFAWVKMSYDRKHKRLFLLDEIYSPKLKNSLAVAKIKEKRNNSMIIYADAAEPKSIAEMRDLGLNIMAAKKGKDSVEHGMKWLQDLDEIVIDKNRTPNAYQEFVLYEYEQTKDGKFISAYPDKNNHIIDAVRYGLNTIISNDTIRIIA